MHNQEIQQKHDEFKKFSSFDRCCVTCKKYGENLNTTTYQCRECLNSMLKKCEDLYIRLYKEKTGKLPW